MTREDAIEHLTTNDNCWNGGADDLKIVEGFTDAKLAQLVRNQLELSEFRETAADNAVVLNEAKKLVETAKTAIVAKLTANLKGDAKAAKVEALGRRTLTDLREIAELAAINVEDEPTGNAGSGTDNTGRATGNGTPTNNSTDDRGRRTPVVNRKEVLPVPSLLDIPEPTTNRKR